MPKEAYIVHKEGDPDTLLLDKNGRVVTEPFDLPSWAPEGVALAKLAERNDFYQRRLGAAMADPLLASNVINVRDLTFICVDEEGEALDYPCDQTFRDANLAAALGVDLETGDISNALVDHYLDNDGKGYTAEELVSKEEAAKAFKQSANG